MFVCIGLTGCGGGGISTGNGGTLNLLKGTYTGPWAAGNDTGTITLHITGLGSVAGTIVDNTTGQTYQVTGKIVNPSLTSTTIDLTETNNGTSVDFSGTIVDKLNFTSFSGTLTEVGSNGVTQTISLSYSGS